MTSSSRKTLNEFYVKTYDKPGTWMADESLSKLQSEIRKLGNACLPSIPEYGVYSKNREAYNNRLISCIYKRSTNELIAFSAAFYWSYKSDIKNKKQEVIHLGLVLVHPDYRKRKLMYWLYHQPLTSYFLKGLCRTVYITSTTMDPVIVGSVSDGFNSVFPDYKIGYMTKPSTHYSEIAASFFKTQGKEIGMYEKASFDPDHFIIKGSSLGVCKSLMVRFEDAPKYRKEPCNQFCKKYLDYGNGDEIIQVGKINLRAVYDSFWWIFGKFGRRLMRKLTPG